MSRWIKIGGATIDRERILSIEVAPCESIGVEELEMWRLTVYLDARPKEPLRVDALFEKSKSECEKEKERVDKELEV